MLGVLLALVAALLFGVLFFATRSGLARVRDPVAGAVATDVVAFVVVLAVGAPAAATSGWTIDLGQLWPFLVAGAVTPGVAQIFFIRAVQDAGPARSAVVIGATPLVSALLAVGLLDEPVRAALVAGTLLVIGGVVALSWERRRPEHFRRAGLVFAAGCVFLFGARDNLVRWGNGRGDPPPPPLLAACAILAGASALLLVYLAVERRGRALPSLGRALLPFAPAGIILGVANDALAGAFERARVGVVAPLNATQALWSVVIAALFFRRVELVGVRVAAAVVLIVAGAVVVGAAR